MTKLAFLMSATINSSVAKTNKPTLVFVHGYLGGSAQWSDQVDYFSRDYTVITPDLPGFGLHNHLPPVDSITSFAQYVLTQLDQQEIGNFFLLGHSMGGMIVQEIIRLAPHRISKLVLYGTGPIGNMPGRFETIEQSQQRLQQDGVAMTAKRIAATWFADGKNGNGYQACADIAKKASLPAGLAALTAMKNWSGEAELPNIKAPTLVLWGDLDKSYLWPLPQQLWQEIPNASLSVVAQCSHAVHLEKPALFNDILADFLKHSPV
jgi:pimeloyl-ACP methyl ester carboxylesterase